MTPEQHLEIAEELCRQADQAGVNAVTRDAAIQRGHLHAHIAMVRIATKSITTLDTSDVL